MKDLNIYIDPVDNFVKTPVDVLMFASDPATGRAYEGALRQKYHEKPMYKWSDERFQEYLDLAKQWEEESRIFKEPESLAEYRDPNKAKIYWIPFPIPTNLNSRSRFFITYVIQLFNYQFV